MFLNLLKFSQKSLHKQTLQRFASVPIQQIKELRNLTGSSIGDCRKALDENDGDFQKARDYLKERGLAQADKRSGKNTQEGVIGVAFNSSKHYAVLGEVNCETDFVAKTDMFLQFVRQLLNSAASSNNFGNSKLESEEEIEDILKGAEDRDVKIADEACKSLFEAKQLAISKLQENIRVSSLTGLKISDTIHSLLGSYVHNQKIDHIGASASLVDVIFEKPLVSGNLDQAQEIVNNIAMQVIATRPEYSTKEDIPKFILQTKIDKIQNELAEILANKPESIRKQIIEGKLQSFYDEYVLVEQQYVLDPSEELTVSISLVALELTFQPPRLDNT